MKCARTTALFKGGVLESPGSFAEKGLRLIWCVAWFVLCRFTPKRYGRAWRNAVLRLFGAKVGRSCVDSSARIFAPWRIEIGDSSSISSNVSLYGYGAIIIGSYAVVSQNSYLCSTSHDYTTKDMRSISNTIRICDWAWVTANVFILPGVTVGEGAVVGASAVVTKDVAPWSVVAGNPARFIKKRVIGDEK